MSFKKTSTSFSLYRLPVHMVLVYWLLAVIP